MTILRSLLLLFIICGLGHAGASRADVLDDLNQSARMKNFNKGSKRAKNKSKKFDWFEDHPNLHKFFKNNFNEDLFFEKLLIKNDSFRLTGKTHHKNKEELIILSANFEVLEEKNTAITVTILIPHPRVYDSVRSGFSKDFSSLEPSALELNSSDELKLSNGPARLFNRKLPPCSLLIKLSSLAVMNLEILECNQISYLPKLAELLDLKVINQLLES